MKCLFVSDAHYPKSSAIVDFLLDNYYDFDKIFILGDLFEFYYGYENFLYPSHMDLINALNVISKKRDVVLFEGNHEYRLEKIKHFLNVEVIKTFLDIKIDGLKIHMEHGDMVDKKDTAYRLFRSFLKNSLMLNIINKINPYFLLDMSKQASSFSKNRLKNKEGRRTDYVFREYAENLIENGISVVILAHIHNPVKSRMNNGLYINCGDFFETFSYVTYSSEEGFSIKYYNG